MNPHYLVVVLLVALGAPVRLATGQVSVGVSGGVVRPARQDLKIHRFDAAGQLTAWEPQRDVAPAGGSIALASLTVFDGGKRLSQALQVDLAFWEVSAVTRPGQWPAMRVGQDRAGLLASWVVRWRPGRSPTGVAVYASCGGGLVHTSVQRGGSGWGPASTLALGLRGPVSGNGRVRVRLELRALTAADVDAPHHEGVWVDTSGSTGWRLRDGPHFDTGFVVGLVGLDVLVRR